MIAAHANAMTRLPRVVLASVDQEMPEQGIGYRKVDEDPQA
jgi:hypothetical protein